MIAPPSVPHDLLADWRATDDTTETPFSAAGVTVTARLRLYEDDRLRARVRDYASVDRSWRFFLAARLELAPRPPVTRALRDLVASRASRGFADRLEGRGFEAVDRTERSSLRTADHEARLFGYDARCRVDGIALSVNGNRVATTRTDGDGAYATVVELDGQKIGETAATERTHRLAEAFHDYVTTEEYLELNI